MATRAEQLERLAERQRKLQEQDRKLQARLRQLKAAESKDERKLDTRRKILIGSMVLAQVEAGIRSREDVNRELAAYLVEDRDRALFNLPATNGSAGARLETAAAGDPTPLAHA